jgi:copper chaperone CopZ
MRELVLRVDGMSCGHCEKAVEKGLSAVTGVRAVKADHAEGTVKLEVEPGVDAAALKAIIVDLGYTPAG